MSTIILLFLIFWGSSDEPITITYTGDCVYVSTIPINAGYASIFYWDKEIQSGGGWVFWKSSGVVVYQPDPKPLLWKADNLPQYRIMVKVQTQRWWPAPTQHFYFTQYF